MYDCADGVVVGGLLQDHTLVGRPNAQQQQDIQLSGLGIMPEHAIVDVQNNEVFITPLDGARSVTRCALCVYVRVCVSVCVCVCGWVCV